MISKTIMIMAVSAAFVAGMLVTADEVYAPPPPNPLDVIDQKLDAILDTIEDQDAESLTEFTTFFISTSFEENERLTCNPDKGIKVHATVSASGPTVGGLGGFVLSIAGETVSFDRVYESGDSDTIPLTHGIPAGESFFIDVFGNSGAIITIQSAPSTQLNCELS